ncbi:hypothetical protein Tco_0705238 [Tanacetum coccineum]|uniref:Uncharacterized protein n=1 Tax=Tanacetum coccineum TaxID=301880 RepID=A0ABQ4Y5G4_9ASTR
MSVGGDEDNNFEQAPNASFFMKLNFSILFGLGYKKIAPRAWYDELSKFLMSKALLKHFQTLIMPDALILEKALLEGYSSLVISIEVGMFQKKQGYVNAMSSAEAIKSRYESEFRVFHAGSFIPNEVVLELEYSRED